MYAFHSSRLLQSKLMFYFSHASVNGLSTVHIQMVQPSILKSHIGSKMIEPHFYRLYSIMTGSKIIAGPRSKKMAPNFEAVVSVLLQISGQLCRGMQYQCIFVEEVVPLLGAMTDKLVLTFFCGRN